jgi:hypothetical protein
MFAPGFVGAQTAPISPAMQSQIRELYRTLIEAENSYDIEKVRALVWDSPDALFVAKTKTVAEGNWAGFWGKDVVVDRLPRPDGGADLRPREHFRSLRGPVGSAEAVSHDHRVGAATFRGLEDGHRYRVAHPALGIPSLGIARQADSIGQC